MQSLHLLAPINGDQAFPLLRSPFLPPPFSRSVLHILSLASLAVPETFLSGHLVPPLPLPPSPSSSQMDVTLVRSVWGYRGPWLAQIPAPSVGPAGGPRCQVSGLRQQGTTRESGKGETASSQPLHSRVDECIPDSWVTSGPSPHFIRRSLQHSWVRGSPHPPSPHIHTFCPLQA